MARYSYLIYLLVLLLGSCAQVGVITGGEQDRAAPKPITENVQPPNASVDFTGNQIVMPFDEYFTLSSPTTSIQMVPPHATINASVDKKTLTLSWKETLRPNTTYAIYLNNTVKDLSEKNDSIMQYVFSTGSTLDSTTFSASVIDAFTNETVAEVVVALYDPNTKTLVNFAQTDRTGVAKLNYLRAGTYELIAFKDENNDLIAQKTEDVGFLADSLVSIDSSGALSTPIRLFSPEEELEILSVKFEAPASFLIETNVKMIAPTVFIDDVRIDSTATFIEEPTRLRVLVDPTNLSAGKISLTSGFTSDTTTYRVLEAQKKGAIRISPKQANFNFAPSQDLSFRVNDVIAEIDTSLIQVIRLEDSVAVYSNATFSGNEVYIDLPRTTTKQYRIDFQEGAITTTTGKSPKSSLPFTVNSEKKYGILSINVASYTEPIILQVFKGTKLVADLSIDSTLERIKIPELEAGDYTFKVIRDTNENGRWDTGNLETRSLPEQIDSFTKVTTVRANWEIEVELLPIQTTP